jgi:DNA-binding NarL/FixJ family response regulator
MENTTSNNFNSISVFLIDDEPIFRLGFYQILTNFPQLELLDFDESISIFQQIKEKNPQLIVLEFKFLSLAKKIIKNNPNLPIFLLTYQLENFPISAIKEIGIKGYAPKNIDSFKLIDILIKIASGESYWHESKKRLSSKNNSQKWLSKVRKSGLNEIEYNLIFVDSQLKNAQSLLDKIFWQGRKRELLAAKWLVNQLLPVEFVVIENQTDITSEKVGQLVLLPKDNYTYLLDKNITDVLTDLSNKLNFNLDNKSNYVLEIDILTASKKQELLKLIFDNIVAKINKIAPEITEQNLGEQNLIFLKDVWQSVTITFFTNNYEQNIELTQYQIVEIIQKELPSNFQNILNYQDIFAQIIRYLILKDELIIGTKIYDYDSEEAQKILTIILETLIVMIANATMQIILNNFGEETIIQESLYQSEMVSLREIARFRNSLSMRYFKQKFLEEPRQVFEGEYELFKIENNQIISHKFKQINRKKELNQLTGIRLFVTILLEFRDAMSPIVRSFVSKLGKGLIFILTQIIGKGIGLIGRGIFDGLGNSLPGNKANKKNN